MNKIIKTKFRNCDVYTLNGLFHREDGPAIEFPSGYKEWFINGKEYSEDKFNQYILKHNLNKI